MSMINVNISVDFRGTRMDAFDHDLMNSMRKCGNNAVLLNKVIEVYLRNTWRVLNKDIIFWRNIEEIESPVRVTQFNGFISSSDSVDDLVNMLSEKLSKAYQKKAGRN